MYMRVEVESNELFVNILFTHWSREEMDDIL